MRLYLMIAFLILISFSCQNSDSPDSEHLNQDTLKVSEIKESDERSLIEIQKLKTKELISAIQEKNKPQIKKMLSGYANFPDLKVDQLLTSIEENWGKLSESAEINDNDNLNKGELDFIFHEQFTETQTGNWTMFSNEQTNAYLRIGVLFNADSSIIGGVVIALLPKK